MSEGDADAASAASAGRVPWVTKVAVLAFLLFFVFAGVKGFEHWPFTGWRLYSTPRTDTDVSYRPYVLQPDGTERAIVYDDLPVAYRHAKLLLMPAEPGHRAVCEGLAIGERREGRAVEEIRVYRTKERLKYDGEEFDNELARELVYTCAGPEAGGTGP